MQPFTFFNPRSPDELFSIIQKEGGTVVAGGTDLLPRMRKRLFSPQCLVNLDKVHELHYFYGDDQSIHIGALTTHQELVESKILIGVSGILSQAASCIGSPQTRNRGTLGGNLANASPAADLLPPLVVLDAEVILISKDGHRNMPVVDFFLGPGKTALHMGEIIQGVVFRKSVGMWGSSFQKIGKRNGMSIAVVSASTAIQVDDENRITEVRVALGSVAPTVVRGNVIEEELLYRIPSADDFYQASLKTVDCISPIDDLRASAAYRTQAAIVLVRRVLEQAYHSACLGGVK